MSIYDHFRVEERPFIDQVLQWKEQVRERFFHKLSDFLDPRQEQIVSDIIGKDNDVSYAFFGGTENAERKRAIIYPTFFEIEKEEFQIVAYQLHYPQKFVEITHRDLLGSMMGLGLKRDKFGDIYINDGEIQIVIAAEVSSYVEANLQQVGKASVQLKRIKLEELIVPKEEWTVLNITVSSLRLDAVLSEIYRLSRSKISPFIEQKRVKVNWKVVEQPSYQLQSGDHLSVRGLGRSKLLTVNGKTKKDKWRIDVGIRK